MRLIDADVLLDSIFKSCNTTEATINNAPTIDAVRVVRCKGCEHYNTTGYPALNLGVGWCNKIGRGVGSDFYCALGAKTEVQHEND
jgi:hypothetical protein